jgi:3-oxoacyl-[acyl-carrier protein] reductase
MIKKLIVTGSSRGIGRALTEYYLEKGWSVVGCSRKPPEFHHDNYQHYCCDLMQEAEILKFFESYSRENNPPDALINNAALAAMNHFTVTPYQTYQNIFSVNVGGAFLFMREAAKLMMLNKNGRIVNFSSYALGLNLAGEGLYLASKAAVETMTKIFAKEVAPSGITVNAIAPTLFKSQLIAGISSDRRESILKSQAISRFCEVHDLCNAVDFFINNKSDFVTGQILALGGPR